jgi:hypothetical protein
MRERLSRTFREIIVLLLIYLMTLVLAFLNFCTIASGEFSSKLNSGGGVVPEVIS